MEPAAFDAGPLADVDCQPAGTRWTLVIVRDLRHPPEAVWTALTEPDQVGRWAPFETDRSLDAAGTDVELVMIDGDVREPLTASILRADRPALLEYTWGPDLLRWELTPTASGTRLTLRHTLAERAMTAKVAAGWHLCLVVAEHLLDGRPVPPVRGSDALRYGWAELHERYAGKLGLPATP